MLDKDIELDLIHVKILLYNILCAVNFIHSCNLMHRDIKTSNILVDSNCNIKICDFGLSRIQPVYTKTETELKHKHKKEFCFEEGRE